MPKDLKLNSDWELVIENGDLVYITGAEAIIQNLKQRFYTWGGEFFLDTTYGVDYKNKVFVKNFDPVVLNATFRNLVLETPGVVDLLEWTIDQDNQTGILSIDFKATINTGEIITFTFDFGDII